MVFKPLGDIPYSEIKKRLSYASYSEIEKRLSESLCQANINYQFKIIFIPKHTPLIRDISSNHA